MADSGRGGVAQWLVDLVMKPGTSLQLVPAINTVLVILVFVLVYLVSTGEGSIHVYIMGFLSLGLMASLNWFISELRKVQQQQAQEGGGDSSVAGAAVRKKAD
eukprot:g16299.t1